MNTQEMKENERTPNVEREGWQAEKLADEASNKESDEIVRQMLRGDESKGDPDERDIAGGTNFENTQYGRKQTKRINNEENPK